MKKSGGQLPRLALIGAILLTSAPLNPAEPVEKKIAPIGYPPGFEEAKKEAEERRKAHEAQRGATSGSEEKGKEETRVVPLGKPGEDNR